MHIIFAIFGVQGYATPSLCFCWWIDCIVKGHSFSVLPLSLHLLHVWFKDTFFLQNHSLLVITLQVIHIIGAQASLILLYLFRSTEFEWRREVSKKQILNIFKTFYFRVFLDLQKGYKDSTISFHVPPHAVSHIINILH